MTIPRLFILLTLFSVHFGLTAQRANLENKSLKELDKQAFSLLESGDTSAYSVAQIAIEKSKGNPSKYLANAFTIQGILNKNKGFYVSALNNYLDALKVSESMHDEGRISSSLNNIGIIYVLQHNYVKAIEYFNKSLKLEEQLHNPAQKSIRLFNLGDAYLKVKQFDIALGYFNSSLIIEEKLKNQDGVNYARLGLTETYIGTNRISDAAAMIDKLVGEEKNFDVEAVVLFKKLKGKLAFQQQSYGQAKADFQSAVSISNTQSFKSELPDLYLLLAKVNEQLGDWKAVSSNQAKYIQINQQLQSNFIKNQLEDLNHQHELESRQREINGLKDQQEKERKSTETLEKLRNYNTKIIVFCILSVLLITGITYKSVRNLVQAKK